MNNQPNLQPTWVTDVYTPEGADRPSHNPPVTQSPDELSTERQTSLAEVVSEANRARRPH